MTSRRPQDAPDYWISLARAMAVRGDVPSALRALRRALCQAPVSPPGLSIFALLLVMVDGDGRVLSHLLRALAVDPANVSVWSALVSNLLNRLMFDEADRFLRRGLAMVPSAPGLMAQWAALLRDVGEPEASLVAYDRAIAIAPTEGVERDSLLALLYVSCVPSERRIARHRAYAARHAPPRPRPPLRATEGRRLHVGYLSSGFFDHPTAAVTVKLIEAHDRGRFEISLFSTGAKQDATSERLAASADHWHALAGLGVQAVADAVQAAGVDVLVGLAGRYDPIVWPVMALRPAPAQVAFHDTATSGIEAIDHLVTDVILSPRGGAEQASERLLRLPSFPLHELSAEAPPVSLPPVAASGRITFGSLNSSAKLNDRVLAIWARVLAAVPDARLLIKSQALAGRRMAARVRAAFALAGVAADRVKFLSDYVERRDLLAVYDRIDIALDAFPYAGGMTTFEALCQGVPVVTLADRDMVGRWGASLAIHAGHPEFVASTPDEYVALAARLAGDRPRLAALRARLRDDFLESPLCDARLKARHLERAYLRMVGAR